MLGVDDPSVSTLGNLHLQKVTFLKTSVDWSNLLLCSSSGWSSFLSESWLSEDSSVIYSFFVFGTTKYLYFVTLSVSNGNVASTRYKSSITVFYVSGLVLKDDYL